MSAQVRTSAKTHKLTHTQDYKVQDYKVQGGEYGSGLGWGGVSK